MKLINSTDWPDHFLRRLVGWCCREIGLPPAYVWEAKFCNRRAPRRLGCAFPLESRFIVNINRDEPKPVQITELVSVTAHELAHLDHFRLGIRSPRGAHGGGETATRTVERLVLASFEKDREALLAAWAVPPKARIPKPKASLQEQRAAQAAAMLSKWRRKQKLAQTKVRQYGLKVRYYERTASRRGH